MKAIETEDRDCLNDEILSRQHWQQFEKRGFDAAEIEIMIAEGLRSVSADELAALGYVDKNGKPYINCGGWVFTHKSGFVQFRPDDLETHSKYLNPTRHKAAIALNGDEQWVTEGLVDAYFIRFRGDTLCGVAAGVSHYKSAPKDSGLNWLFDADGWLNGQVFTNLINAGIHTGGKIQLFPKVTDLGKDGAQEYFTSGKTPEDFKALLKSAFTPKQFVFELPKHWKGLPKDKQVELSKTLLKNAHNILDRTEQKILWKDLAKLLGVTLKDIEAIAKEIYWQSEEGKQKLDELATQKDSQRCEFLAIKEAIETACDGDLRLNLLKQDIEFKGEPINPGRYKTFVAELINKDVPREDCTEILGAIAESNAYHPVQDYLERVHLQYGDTTRSLLNDAASRLLSPKGNLPIYNAYLKKWMVGAVARIYKPGCQFDHALILQGSQGLYKSTVLRTLAGDDFFDDNLGDLASPKDELLILYAAWIHEWAEFDRVTGRREASQIKAFTTRREDRFRAPYDRAVKAHKRQSVLCGTVNDNSFLVDDENRRFWIIPLSKPADIETARAERDKLWAAAVSFFKSGELPTLTREESSVSAELNKTYQKEDTWESLIESWLNNPANLYESTAAGDDRQYFTIKDLLEGIGIDANRQTQTEIKRAQRILTRLGHESVGKIRLRRGVESFSVRAWACSGSSYRNSTGTEPEQPSNTNGFNNPVPVVPVDPIEESGKEYFHDGYQLNIESKEKNGGVSNGRVATGTTGTAEQPSNTNGFRSSASVPVIATGTKVRKRHKSGWAGIVRSVDPEGWIEVLWTGDKTSTLCPLDELEILE